MSSVFKDLGVGVGFRPTHSREFQESLPKSVSWVEVISENYMPWKGQKEFGDSIHILETIRGKCPVALHGVSMNLGSTDALDFEYLSRLKLLIDRIDPVVVSDHLSWTGVNGINTHDLLPLPYTEEALKHLTQRVEQVQSFLGSRILIENPSSYFEYTHSTMSEPEFIDQLLARTGCGLLLDVNNVYVSSINHHFDPVKYLSALSKQHIEQIHLAGHSDINGHLIDTHDAPICSEVWDLYQQSLRIFGKKSVMIERDGNIPEWSELELELQTLKGLYDIS